jgi:hypothetical protein
MSISMGPSSRTTLDQEVEGQTLSGCIQAFVHLFGSNIGYEGES